MCMTALFNHILITVVLFGATVAVVFLYASYDSNIDELFRALGWRKLKYQRLESAAVMMYKSLHGMTPEYRLLDLCFETT